MEKWASRDHLLFFSSSRMSHRLMITYIDVMNRDQFKIMQIYAIATSDANVRLLEINS